LRIFVPRWYKILLVILNWLSGGVGLSACSMTLSKALKYTRRDVSLCGLKVALYELNDVDLRCDGRIIFYMIYYRVCC
jgi:septum formation inhibitor-activating ATPase MinD